MFVGLLACRLKCNSVDSNSSDLQRRQTTIDDVRSTTTTTTTTTKRRACSGPKTRAEPHVGVGLTGMGAKGSHLGVVIANAGEPGLGIDSPTMPGIGENHTHRSQGSLC